MPRDTRIDCFLEALENCMAARQAGDEAAIKKAAGELMERYDAMASDQVVDTAELLSVHKDAKNGLSFAAIAFRRLGDKGMAEAMEQRFPRLERLIAKLKDQASEGSGT